MESHKPTEGSMESGPEQSRHWRGGEGVKGGMTLRDRCWPLSLTEPALVLHRRRRSVLQNTDCGVSEVAPKRRRQGFPASSAPLQIPLTEILKP